MHDDQCCPLASVLFVHFVAVVDIIPLTRCYMSAAKSCVRPCSKSDVRSIA